MYIILLNYQKDILINKIGEYFNSYKKWQGINVKRYL